MFDACFQFLECKDINLDTESHEQEVCMYEPGPSILCRGMLDPALSPVHLDKIDKGM